VKNSKRTLAEAHMTSYTYDYILHMTLKLGGLCYNFCVLSSCMLLCVFYDSVHRLSIYHV